MKLINSRQSFSLVGFTTAIFATSILSSASPASAALIKDFDLGNHVSADITSNPDGTSTYSNFKNNSPRKQSNDAYDFHFSYGTGGKVINLDWTTPSHPYTDGRPYNLFPSDEPIESGGHSLNGVSVIVPPLVPASEIYAYWTDKNHQPISVPEPLTILGSITALGFGIGLKRKQAKAVLKDV